MDSELLFFFGARGTRMDEQKEAHGNTVDFSN